MYIRENTKLSDVELVLFMKNISLTVLVSFFSLVSLAQPTPVEQFLDGKSVVLVSAAPAETAPITWKELVEEVHPAFVEAGGDPVAYFDLEEVILSEGIKNTYASHFITRQIRNIILLIRKTDGRLFCHIYPFSGNRNIISPGNNWSTKATHLEDLKEQIQSIGLNKKSQNFLVIEVPEYPSIPGLENNSVGNNYIQAPPLNLDVFKLGILLTGAAGNEDFLNTFRQDIYGKDPNQVEAEQLAEKEGLEQIFNAEYPFETEFLTTAKSNQELINEKVQFILMKQEGREADLMRSMGVPLEQGKNPDKIVVKYYIRFLVRNELYIGEKWDASPDWKVALRNFLEQITSEN
ncbi:hypothetical protein GCM10027284_18940 [Cyclobacterium sediminis]